jgi:hypothetical protein
MNKAYGLAIENFAGFVGDVGGDKKNASCKL